MADDSGGPSPEIRTINLPGVLDVLSVPPLEDAQLKRERLTRWRLNAERSTIPEALRWLPQVINFLDDAQDVLITALILSKPLLRRLPSRFIPYLGWALLANDVVNLFNAMLSAPLNPRSLKADFYKTTRRSVAGRTAGVRAAEAFLLPGRVKFIPFALTAGQVLYSFTGWGLRLGPIMQTLSESWWSVIAALRGARVEIKGPPPSDPAAKAARFLAQGPTWNAFAWLANPVEIAVAIAAQNAAMGLLGAPVHARVDDQRLQQLADLTCPLFEPWSPTSKLVLAEAGYPPLKDQRCAIPTVDDTPTVGLAVRATLADKPDLDVDLATESRDTWTDWPVGMMATEAAQHTWDVFGGGVDVVVPLNSPMERMLGLALEEGLMPPFFALPWERQITGTLYKGQLTDADGWITQREDTTGTFITHGFRYPIAYPPPAEDPTIQIAHWCAVGLAIFCKRQIMLPYYRVEYLNPRAWIDHFYKRGRERMNPMLTASLLVWGNVWFRTSGGKDDAPRGTQQQFKTCVPNRSGWPSLSGVIPENDYLQQILNALPPIGTDPVPIGTDNSAPVKWQTRFWLDTYLKDQDARRRQGPTAPALQQLDPPPNDQESSFWENISAIWRT